MQSRVNISYLRPTDNSIDWQFYTCNVLALQILEAVQGKGHWRPSLQPTQPLGSRARVPHPPPGLSSTPHRSQSGSQAGPLLPPPPRPTPLPIGAGCALLATAPLPRQGPQGRLGGLSGRRQGEVWWGLRGGLQRVLRGGLRTPGDKASLQHPTSPPCSPLSGGPAR